jgi:hypothetical protein
MLVSFIVVISNLLSNSWEPASSFFPSFNNRHAIKKKRERIIFCHKITFFLNRDIWTLILIRYHFKTSSLIIYTSSEGLPSLNPKSFLGC